MDRQFSITGTMIGNQYTFFLGNLNMGSSYYLYQINTPGLSSNVVPYFSMTKISERTKNEPSGHDNDLLSICSGIRKIGPDEAVGYLKTVIKKEDTVIDKAEKGKFPLVELEYTNGIQRSMILGLRDTLRWKTYKFQPGAYIDILWTVTDYLVFKICGDKDSIWLEPVAAYRNTDPEMKEPLKVDFSRINYPKEKFGGQNRASDINRTLRRVERSSFDRRPFRF